MPITFAVKTGTNAPKSSKPNYTLEELCYTTNNITNNQVRNDQFQYQTYIYNIYKLILNWDFNNMTHYNHIIIQHNCTNITGLEIHIPTWGWIAQVLYPEIWQSKIPN